MNISSNTSQSFLGRAQIIKDADRICRNVNSAFPHFSPSYSWINYDRSYKFNEAFNKYDKILSKIRTSKSDTEYAYDYYNNLMQMVRKYKCANCEELSEITYLACKNKNLKNVNLIGIYGYNTRKDKLIDYDHMAVSFRKGNKTVIIDPWFGIADFAQNCLVKYKQKYHEFFKYFSPDLKMVFRTEPSVRISKSDFEDLMKIYPELQ